MDDEHDLRSRPTIRPLNAIEFTQRVCGIDPNEIASKLSKIADDLREGVDAGLDYTFGGDPLDIAELLLAARALIAIAYQAEKRRGGDTPRVHRARARLANSILSASAPDAVEELVRAILEAELNDNDNG